MVTCLFRYRSHLEACHSTLVLRSLNDEMPSRLPVYSTFTNEKLTLYSSRLR